MVANPDLRQPRSSRVIDFISQMGKLDWGYIRVQLRPLAELKSAPEILDQLELRRIRLLAADRLPQLP